VSNANFSQPTAAWKGGPNLGFGNAGKDAVVGPGRTNFTTALYKSFAFTERTHFELRADTSTPSTMSSSMASTPTLPHQTLDL